MAASFFDSRFIFSVSLVRFFSVRFSQKILFIRLPVNILISEMPHHERLCFMSFALDLAPAPRHCVIMTARFANSAGAGRCCFLCECGIFAGVGVFYMQFVHPVQNAGQIFCFALTNPESDVILLS